MLEINFLFLFHSKTHFHMVYMVYYLFNLHVTTNENNKDDDKNWPYKMLIIRPSGSGKINALLNLIQKQNNGNPIDKISLYA